LRPFHLDMDWTAIGVDHRHRFPPCISLLVAGITCGASCGSWRRRAAGR
jgi:hypothetical protein